ncbi:lysophospholipase L1-like esterase [Kitasatospora gansuensis]|uniref:Lysophospholipase L1-like esterase n=1 Tax=Kitasatospora gansuensis TaxID=258050 RepID=A0A7W7WLA1_9ACTN|nr:SGNH/GDSL hydrolase family protein [Kitasatospora gansuensis]MBB4951597.1 lysophospholipase L1-like esterase [Kitasatospora gansuensis]
MPSTGTTPARTTLTALALTAALTGAAVTAASPAAAQTSYARYVALGDSYASAAGVPDQIDTACARSSRNYPSLVNAALAPAARADVTCGGATTAHMTTTQSGSGGPQFDALNADTDLVTLTIGGNDIGFADIIVRCATLGLFSANGAPCKSSYTKSGVDQLSAKIDATASKIAATLDGIRQRSPRATVLVTGYPAILPDNGTNCFSTVSIAKGDAPWLRDTEKHLNAVIAAQAAGHGARYVDTYTPSIGHDACKPTGTRWLEPLFASGAAAFHPNAAGEQSMATATLAAIG